jgi:hypothetical protein
MVSCLLNQQWTVKTLVVKCAFVKGKNPIRWDATAFSLVGWLVCIGSCDGMYVFQGTECSRWWCEERREMPFDICAVNCSHFQIFSSQFDSKNIEFDFIVQVLCLWL